jgi:regulatory LuxR family protein
MAAEPWAERARKELRASGESVRGPDPAASDPAHAARAADRTRDRAGRTNREAGAELFLSPKTIEIHLSRAYRKLGITSRTQLVRLLSERHINQPQQSTLAARELQAHSKSSLAT